MDVWLTEEKQTLLNRHLSALGYAPGSFQWSDISSEPESAGVLGFSSRPPIGRPINNTQVYILDNSLQPMPIGIVGELYIGGAGLARGYLNRPELTAERFIDNPFGDGCLYKSGDLARYLANGTIEFLGRVDHQVKLRGFRIELGEVEAVLNGHEQVHQSVVMVREDSPGNKRLVGYVVGGTEMGAIKTYLQEQLPDYMVPSVLVPMEKLPLTPNGKLDRQALPVPSEEDISSEYVVPQTERQRLIASLMADVLSLPVERIGLNDNFFELGGHSLLAMQLVTRLRQAFETEVMLQELFEIPTVVGLDTILTAANSRRHIPLITPVERDGSPLLLSYAQERLWFLDQLDKRSAAYNISGAVQIEGLLDIETLQAAIDALVRRHEILRTTFTSLEGRAVQEIHPVMAIPLQVFESTELAESLSDWLHTRAQALFDLSTGPLLTVSVVRLSETTTSVLAVTMHHIISDGWSIGVFINELAALYNSYRQGESPQLLPLKLQYADYTLWQRQWLQGEALSTQLSYWQEQLSGAPALLSLPTDHPRPAVQRFAGKTHTVTLPLSLLAQLKVLGQRHQVTLFMTLLAGFQVLLYRYSRQRDVLVGTPIANRQQPELEGLIGCFVNTLVLRTQLDETDSVTQLLQQVRRTALGAYSHQDVPFEQVVETLQPQRTLSHSPLFQVMFVLQNMPMSPLELLDGTMSPLLMDGGAAQFDLTLSMHESEAGLMGRWTYNRDLFESATIERMAGHFETLLGAMVSDASQPVGTLPMLSPAEQTQLMKKWNDTAVEYPRHDSLHKLFEQQVARTPEATAVRFESESLSYAELNARSNQLARYLQGLGVGPETLVGICMERSLEMVVGLLGVLKAGGAYVPLDPSNPRARLQFMLDDTQVAVLLTQEHLLAVLPEQSAQVLCLDSQWSEVAQASDENLQVTVTKENLAYVIYTSGSTGQPKGVMNSHGGICNRLLWMQAEYGLTPDDRVVQKTPFSFDVSVWEFFWPLLVGAELVMARPEGHKDSGYLIELMVARAITTVHFVPSMLSAFLQDPEVSRVSSLKRVMCSGEALPMQLQQSFFAQLECELHNLYGPTEAAIDVTSWRCQQEPSGASVPIGRPIANTQIYILDEALQPVGVGISGELHIGGVGLARGYLGRSELTAERFITNPFGAGRLYKSGDLARYLSDGTIEYLGRIDHQVKLRGFRIELGEIESVLSHHEQVQQCVVMMREDMSGGQRLVAYVVSDDDDDVDRDILKAYLSEHLPDYMVPTVMVPLDVLPLTANGKVDRRALPIPDDELSRTGEFVAPETELQTLLATIWQNILGLDQVGIQDNFFELGGHSLLAIQAISQIRQTFHIEISVRQMFETPTVAGLANFLANCQPSEQDTAVITPSLREQPIPLSFAQERLWFMEQLNPGNVAYNQSAAVRLQGKLNITALRQGLQSIVERHEILRTIFPIVQGQPVQQIVSSLEVVVPLTDLQTFSPVQQREEVKRLAISAEQKTFDLAQGPLFRASVLKLSDQEHVLLWSTHHIVSDMWSIGILIHELAVLYTAQVDSSPLLLDPLPVQYADFTLWQRQWLTGETLERQLAYWRQKLGGNLPVLNLPTDYPPPAAPSLRGATLSFQLSADLTAKLQSLSREVGVTLFMTLLAGFKSLLYAYTGQSDLIVGTDVANRNRAETEGLIGFFVNLLLLRTDLSGNPSFRGLLQRVQNVALDGYAHQDLPFPRLVQALQTDTDLEGQRRSGATPLFQVLFVMQNTPMASLDLPELTLTPLDMDTGSAKFDLALFIYETSAGITVAWNYSTDRFAKGTVDLMARQYETLLQQVVEQPDSLLEQLATQFTKRQSGPKATKRRKKFKRVAPQAVQQSTNDLVTIKSLICGVLTLQPKHSSVDLSSWAREHRATINQKLQQQGALLFRGFSILSATDFEQVAEAICPNLFGEYGDLPRTGVSDKVYGSTPYPEDKAILFHNESSHLQQWPMKIWFCCLQPSKQGGETPIVDCRQAYQILSPEMRDRLEKKRLMYVRNYIKGLDVDWQDFFHTDDRSIVEQRCQAADVEWEWLADDGLQTRQVRPAVVRHPHTKDWVVFNQLQLHHLSYLDEPTQKSLLSLFGEERLPRQVYYGDGSPIEPSVLDALQSAYEQATKLFPWQQGDILMLDNMLMAHGRNPYIGPRKITVAMGEIMTQLNLRRLLAT